MDRAELRLLTLLFSRAVVVALIRLIILFNENLDDITCKPQCFDLFNALLTHLGTIDKTSLSSWTVVEPAVEVLAGCLPTMAPLLNIGVYLKNLSSILRSPFTSRSRTSGSGDTKTNRSQYSRELNDLKLRPDGEVTMVSGASAKRSVNASEDDDLVPLHSIMVRQDVDMKETRK